MAVMDILGTFYIQEIFCLVFFYSEETFGVVQIRHILDVLWQKISGMSSMDRRLSSTQS